MRGCCKIYILLYLVIALCAYINVVIIKRSEKFKNFYSNTFVLGSGYYGVYQVLVFIGTSIF